MVVSKRESEPQTIRERFANYKANLEEAVHNIWDLGKSAKQKINNWINTEAYNTLLAVEDTAADLADTIAQSVKKPAQALVFTAATAFLGMSSPEATKDHLDAQLYHQLNKAGIQRTVEKGQQAKATSNQIQVYGVIDKENASDLEGTLVHLVNLGTGDTLSTTTAFNGSYSTIPTSIDPNPTEKEVFQPYDLTIINILGETVLNQRITAPGSINLHELNLADGMYIAFDDQNAVKFPYIKGLTTGSSLEASLKKQGGKLVVQGNGIAGSSYSRMSSNSPIQVEMTVIPPDTTHETIVDTIEVQSGVPKEQNYTLRQMHIFFLELQINNGLSHQGLEGAEVAVYEQGNSSNPLLVDSSDSLGRIPLTQIIAPGNPKQINIDIQKNGFDGDTISTTLTGGTPLHLTGELYPSRIITAGVWNIAGDTPITEPLELIIDGSTYQAVPDQNGNIQVPVFAHQSDALVYIIPTSSNYANLSGVVLDKSKVMTDPESNLAYSVGDTLRIPIESLANKPNTIIAFVEDTHYNNPEFKNQAGNAAVQGFNTKLAHPDSVWTIYNISVNVTTGDPLPSDRLEHQNQVIDAFIAMAVQDNGIIRYNMVRVDTAGIPAQEPFAGYVYREEGVGPGNSWNPTGEPYKINTFVHTTNSNGVGLVSSEFVEAKGGGDEVSTGTNGNMMAGTPLILNEYGQAIMGANSAYPGGISFSAPQSGYQTPEFVSNAKQKIKYLKEEAAKEQHRLHSSKIYKNIPNK